MCSPTDFEGGVARSGAQLGERPETVRVWLLGGFRLSVGSRPIEEKAWRLKKAASLVKLLALAPSHRLHREQAMDLLWPDLGKKAASNNLRQVLYAARRVLDPASDSHSRHLSVKDEQIALCPEGQLWVDVEAFEEAVSAARRSREPAAYRAALDLYAGELLPADRYEEWAEVHRRRLRETHLSLLLGLARLYEERADYDPAAEVLGRVVSEEPVREEAHASLMRLYALTGREAEALAQYVLLEEVLSRELGTEPAASSRALREEIAVGRFPLIQQPSSVASTPEESPGTGKHNLPAPRTSFVGREREFVEVKRALAMTGLLTLTGAGGSGKTRLALEVARSLVGSYPDGVWLAELAAPSEGELVPQAVAGVLGIRERPGQSLTDTLVEALRTKTMLLVLDNCEHLVDAVARLVALLLDSCPWLRILATSREALRLIGEIVWPVALLSVPDVGRRPTVGELEGYESAQLFVARARERNPAFALKPENAQAVAKICVQLEGLPLAVELAAARIKVLPPQALLNRLSDRLKLLTGGPREFSERQRTLRNTIEWSYDLLDEGEKILFERLAVFSGGSTLEAMETVCDAQGDLPVDVLDGVSSLLDKSLLRQVEGAGDEPRFVMLETIREFAREKLKKSNNAEAIKCAHTEYFLALAEQAEPRVQEPEAATSLGRLESEHDNIRAALSWSLESGEAELGLRLGAALLWFWSARGYWSEGARWLEEALARDGAAEPATRAGALSSLGVVLGRQSDFEQAEACHEEALALYEELGDQGRVAESLAHLAWMAEFRGDAPRATTLFEKSLAAARVSGNSRPIPSALNGLAYIAFESEAFERAQWLWGKALALNREQGNVLEVATVLNSMGYTELARGNQERATALLEESLPLNRELGNKHGMAHCLMALGIAATLQGEPERAKVLLKEGLAIDVELGSKADIAETLEGLAAAAGALGEHVRAARLWGVAGALRETIDIPWWTAERLLHEPQLVAARSRMDEAIWETAFAEGRNMGLEEAVEYGLSEEETTTASSQALNQPLTHEQPPALTKREEEVASLVVRGLTNRRIAEELFLSERTVHRHVSNVLKKLGIASREQVAARLADR